MTYPTIRPELTLDFANSRQLDPRITFSRTSGATYLNPDTGLITTASDHEARFEKEGLLIEEARTNDTYPSTFDGTTGTWRYTNYVTPNQTTAPDGTNTGALLDFEMVGASGNLNFDSNTPQVSGTRSFSFWCKTASPGAGTEMKLELVGWTYSDGATGNRPYTLDFDTETKSTSSDFEVQAYPNGWYRCMISKVSQSASANGYLSFRIDDNPQNWYIWGMQSEEGTFPTSYIPTSGSTLTRSADIAQMTGDNFSSWYNQSEGSFTYDVNVFGGLAGIAELRVGTNQGSRGQFTRSGFRHRMRINGSNAQVNGGIQYPNGFIKLAYRMQPGDHQQAINGVIQNTYAGGNFGGPIPLYNNMWIGRSENLTEYLNGHISRLSYYNQRLTDAELQTLTL